MYSIASSRIVIFRAFGAGFRPGCSSPCSPNCFRIAARTVGIVYLSSVILAVSLLRYFFSLADGAERFFARARSASEARGLRAFLCEL